MRPLAPSARVTPHGVGRCREATEGPGPEGLPPAGGWGREPCVARKFSGNGQLLSLRPSATAPPLALRATSPVPGESVLLGEARNLT